jgi:hypothetical protein
MDSFFRTVFGTGPTPLTIQAELDLNKNISTNIRTGAATEAEGK